MEKSRLHSIIQKFLSGETSEKEKHLLNRFYDSYDNEITEFEPKKEEIFKNQLKKDVFAAAGITIKPKRSISPAVFRYAAAIAFLIILSSAVLYFLKIGREKKQEFTWLEKITEYGQKASIELTDGTKIILNAGSKLKYPEKFIGNQREVFLEGEAYFSVAHDPIKPFIVHTGEVYTTVLGTKFNVKNFDNEQDIAISLIEGKVKVTKETHNEKQTELVLKPMQQIILNKADENQIVGSFDPEEETGWKDNILVFNNVAFEKVLTRLERNFGVKFELKDNSFRNIKIKADFQNESLDTIVKSLAKLTGLQYKTEKNVNSPMKIIFYKKRK
jgi:transmembrane sensor